MIMEDVSVDAVTYRQNVIGKDSVFQAMREKIWWQECTLQGQGRKACPVRESRA